MRLRSQLFSSSVLILGAAVLSTALAATPAPAPAGFAVSGTVDGPADTSVSLTGNSAQTTVVKSGAFSFSGLKAGEYTVAAGAAGQVFTPVSVAVNVDGAVRGIAFAAASTSAPTFRIAGVVSGSAAAGVVVTLNGADVGSVVADLGGSYDFSGLPAGTYTVSAWHPAMRSVHRGW